MTSPQSIVSKCKKNHQNPYSRFRVHSKKQTNKQTYILRILFNSLDNCQTVRLHVLYSWNVTSTTFPHTHKTKQSCYTDRHNAGKKMQTLPKEMSVFNLLIWEFQNPITSWYYVNPGPLFNFGVMIVVKEWMHNKVANKSELIMVVNLLNRREGR